MEDYLLGSLLFVAIVIGWLLGRFARSGAPVSNGRPMPSDDYFRGLNLLLNEQQDEAMEIFSRTLEVNSDTMDTFLVMGSLFRRRGEVDRAIRIHQDLLARPNLNKEQQTTVRFELARDYLKAGVLDRSERILRELVEEGGNCASASLKYLLSIFEQEKEWEQAINLADKMGSADTKNLATSFSHYYCEMAECALKLNDLVGARQHARKAQQVDRGNVRASLIQGQVEYRAGRPKDAIKALRRVRQQDASFLPETLEPLAVCYSELGQTEELVKYLFECLANHPAISVVLALSDKVAELEGDEEGAFVLSEYLKKRPSVRGLNRLIDYHIKNTDGAARDNLSILRTFTATLIQNKPVYRCLSCGFEGKTLYWQCPHCKNWGLVKPIHGLEGE
jgi:lipopolysaccharide biosynthesis regulator YciM